MKSVDDIDKQVAGRKLKAVRHYHILLRCIVYQNRQNSVGVVLLLFRWSGLPNSEKNVVIISIEKVISFTMEII